MFSAPVKLSRRLGFRLAALYAAVLLLTVIIFSGFLYYRLRHHLYKQHDYFLEMQSIDFAGEVIENLPDIEKIKNELDEEIPSGHQRRMIYRLWTPDGKIVLQSDYFPVLDNSLGNVLATLNQPPKTAFCWTGQTGHHYPFRMTAKTVSGNDGTVLYIIESGYSLKLVMDTLWHYQRNFVMFFLPLALAGIFAGSWLARKSLMPISEITSAARAVSSESLEKRVPASGTGDELDQLAGVLNEMLARIQDAFQRVERFSADIAHEIRTPLTVLKGEAESALVSHASADELRAIIAAQAETVERLNQLVNDMLFLARKGMEAPARRVVDLNQCICDLAETFEPLAEDAGVKMIAETGASCRVWADEPAIARAFANVLENAIKYTPRGGAISVSVKNDGTVLITDTGCGISPENMPRIFERFFREDTSRARETGGFGLGLSIAKQIVEAHGGSIKISSESGKGTSVSITIPLAPSA